MNRTLQYFTVQESQRLLKPIIISVQAFSVVIVIFGIGDYSVDNNFGLLLFGLLFALYGGLFQVGQGWLNQNVWIKWVAMLIAIGITWVGLVIIPENWLAILHISTAFVAMILVIAFGRSIAWSFIGIVFLADFLYHLSFQHLDEVYFAEHLSMIIFSAAMTETLYRLTTSSAERVHRLTALNEFSRKITLSLEVEQVMSLLNAAIQSALDADTYFVGVLNGETLHLDLLYDDGEYFAPVDVPIEGSLSGWILRHRRSLFIPDLRKQIDLEGVKVVVTGNNKDNISWMGVPMIAPHIIGVIGIGSYKPDAFNRADFELLEHLGQQAALSLDSAHHHTEVERQSKLDSLTGTYNHGNFIRMMEEEAQEARMMNETMSLIMLDIDYFKQYNDTYGHLTGDLVLIQLVETIRKYIHTTDIVGRWGGEEFVICLPNTNGEQATLVSRRIQQTMMELRMTHPTKGDIPAPTVSQGVAVFPMEAEDVYKLVDVADQRLYIAKERGRNQIEPNENHWKKIINP